MKLFSGAARWQPSRLVVGVVALTLTLAGCGSSESGSTDQIDGGSPETLNGRSPETLSGASSASSEAPVSDPAVPAAESPSTEARAPSDGIQAPFRVGAEVLADDGFSALAGKRVGVVLNQASVVDGEPLLDALANHPDVDLVAVFAPEHGVRGDLPAGAVVADAVDPASGVPIYSLYGATKTPSLDDLANLDVLLFDLQDVGSRNYTYISTMGLAMQAASEAGVVFIVLDRPNPLGGRYLAGPVREPGLNSFVGQYPIPSAHGMTTGELARAIKAEEWLGDLADLDLQVVPMEGWHGGLRWPDLGRSWIPPSPGLPTTASSDVYSGMVLFEATTASVGRGTPEPFVVVGAPWVDPDALVAELEGRGLPGVRFEATEFVPQANESVPEPDYEGQTVFGVHLVVEDGSTYRPVETAVHLFAILNEQSASAGKGPFIDNPQLLDLLSGEEGFRVDIESGQEADAIIARWAEGLVAFNSLRLPHLLYDR